MGGGVPLGSSNGYPLYDSKTQISHNLFMTKNIYGQLAIDDTVAVIKVDEK